MKTGVHNKILVVVSVLAVAFAGFAYAKYNISQDERNQKNLGIQMAYEQKKQQQESEQAEQERKQKEEEEQAEKEAETEDKQRQQEIAELQKKDLENFFKSKNFFVKLGSSKLYHEKFEKRYTYNVLVLGDEFALGYGANDVNQKWTTRFKKALESEYDCNISMDILGEEGIDAYRGLINVGTLKKDKNYDLIITCFRRSNDNPTDRTGEPLLGIANVLNAKYPNSEIINLVENSAQNEIITQAQTASASIFYSYSVDGYLNMKKKEGENLYDENSNVTPDGQKYIAQLVSEKIREKVSAFAERRTADANLGGFKNCSTATKKESDNLSYKINCGFAVNCIVFDMSMDNHFSTDIEVFADGKSCYILTLNHDGDLGEKKVVSFDDVEIAKAKTITLKFSNPTAAACVKSAAVMG